MATVSTDRRNSVLASLAIKAPCITASTANLTLSGEQTIDGVACVTGDRVLVKDQTTASENGIYEVNTSTWSRTLDFDGTLDVAEGVFVFVTRGTSTSGFWYLSTTGTITVGTTSLTFTKTALSLYSSVAFDNNSGLEGKDTGGTVRNLAKVNSSDQSEFGNAALDTLIDFLNSAQLGGNNSYIITTNDDIYLTAGATYVLGTGWVAKNTSAMVFYISRSGAYVSLYYNTGLTIGNTFILTQIWGVNNSGQLAVGSVDFSSANITNKPQFVADANYPLFSSLGLSVAAGLTISTWTSVGPTGSGATVIWTALDSIPAGADWVELKIQVDTTNSSGTTTDCNAYLYGRPSGKSTTADAASELCRARVYVDPAPANVIGVNNDTHAKIQLSASNIFELYWNHSTSNASLIVIYVVGYGYN